MDGQSLTLCKARFLPLQLDCHVHTIQQRVRQTARGERKDLNPQRPLGQSLSTSLSLSLSLFKEEPLTAVSSRALNPALIDIEFSIGLMLAVFIPAALAIDCDCALHHVNTRYLRNT